MQRLAAPPRVYFDNGAAPPPEPGRSRRWRVLGWVSIALSALLVVGSLTAYGFWRRLDGQITRENVDDKLGENRPAKLNNSINILLMGSDSRQGENARYGTEEGERSDTTILLHISPGGDRAIGLSFPRDTMVQRPSCKTRNGGTQPGGLSMLNAAYSIGGPSCTWKTIEAITDIRIDHYVEVDFTGFKRVVDALDGVEICVPKAVNDPKAELYLRAGKQTVNGDQALGYVRTRTGGLGDGSDLSRIKRQQQFMASVVNKATSQGMLTDPGKVYGFLSAVTKSMKTDNRLTLSVMQRLAGSMQGLSAGKVRFVTVPVQAYPADPNRVQFNNALARPLFKAIRQDNEVPQNNPGPKPPAAGQAGGRPGGARPGPAQPPVPPNQVKVAVYNGTPTDGLGQRVADQLAEKNFQVVSVGNTKAKSTARTQILYGAGAERHAAALAAVLPGRQPRPSATARPGQVYLVIGRDGANVAGAARQVPKVAGEIRADQDVCAQT
ncbi:LCP family protein [Actinomadura miaoliensis]|uniref:LytR family transcriptional regulator n=1 Tax=Actinomadura miaoliensis TaxID=430685 RepID=A0ABP7WXS9_9ACTN